VPAPLDGESNALQIASKELPQGKSLFGNIYQTEDWSVTELISQQLHVSR
ncbi:hypothetical protein K439DRAFT_1361342, partial [Ramaria rubella]